MRIGSCVAAVCAAAVCLQAGSAGAQSRVLTLVEVLARAREHAPQIVSARLALEETRGRLIGASIRFQANPEVDASLGNRNGPDRRFTDFGVGIGQMFEPGSRRSARIDSANASIAQASAISEDTTRTVLRLAAAAFYRVLHATERIRLLNATQDLVAGVYSVADRRYRAGDIAVLDVNIARASLGRVRAEQEAAEAARALALGDLKQLLGLDEDIGVQGTFSLPAGTELTAMLQAASQRPELRALEAAVQEAEADTRVAGTFTKPEYGLGVRYAHEEGDQILLGSVTLRLPVASKGQELRAVSSARATRLRAELDAARTRIRLEVRAAFDAYNRRLAAVRILETDAIPGLDENDTLSTRSFDVGQLGLPDLLLIRREILETRSQYLEALLEAALARIDLDASAAILQ